MNIDGGAGSRAQVLCESKRCSEQRRHLSSPLCLFLFLPLSALSSATGMDLEFSSLLYNDGVLQGSTKNQILFIDYYLLNRLWKLRVL